MSRSSQSKKESALQFLQRATFGSVEEAFAMVTDNFRHHNAFVAQGSLALKTAMAENAIKFNDKRIEVLRALEEGDLVAVHSRIRLQREQAGFAVVHIFRFEGDRIAEMWDVAQDIPPDSPNSDGMF